MNPVETSITALRNGKLVGLIDDATPHGIAYLLADARAITAENISRMVNLGGGIICAALSNRRLNALGLPPMNSNSSLVKEANATAQPTSSDLVVEMRVSVEARQGVTTGISAADRARTLRVLANTEDPKSDLVMPGHIFPIGAHDGGVLVRSSVPEAAVDLLSINSLSSNPPPSLSPRESLPAPACVAFTHILSKTGDFMRAQAAKVLFSEQNISSLAVSDVIGRRLETESILEKIADVQLPSKHSQALRAVCLRSKFDGLEHLALIAGDVNQTECKQPHPIPVRLQAEDRLQDLLKDSKVIERAFASMGEQGVFVYIRHPAEGVLAAHINGLGKSTNASPKPQQLRQLGVGAQILRTLGVKKIKLLTRSQPDLSALAAFDIEVASQESF